MNRNTVFTFLFAGLICLASPTVFAQCVPTVALTPGTHYQSTSQLKTNTGKGLKLGGYVRAAGDCKAIAGARISRWQANKKGKYEDSLRVYQFSNNKGRYDFSTERPGTAVPHIHFMVTAEGYKTLITQWIGEAKKKNRTEFNLILEPIN